MLDNSIFVFPLYTAEAYNVIGVIATDDIDYKDGKFIFSFC